MGDCTGTFEQHLILRPLLFANYYWLVSRQDPLRWRGRKESWARKNRKPIVQASVASGLSTASDGGYYLKMQILIRMAH
jgi:hypothetical protein